MCTLHKVEQRREKRELLDEIEKITYGPITKCCIFGEFNVVQKKEERTGYVFDSGNADDFNDFISRNDLQEVSLGARKYPRISQDGTKLRKLDRFLLSKDLLEEWSSLSSVALLRISQITIRFCLNPLMWILDLPLSSSSTTGFLRRVSIRWFI